MLLSFIFMLIIEIDSNMQEPNLYFEIWRDFSTSGNTLRNVVIKSILGKPARDSIATAQGL